jgi:predicted negative regulator of RcsB-dependent stress response
MKAEERHELRENDLANWLQFGLWAFLKNNGSYLLLIVALGFLGFQLWNLYQRKQENARAIAFTNLIDAEAAALPQGSIEDWTKSAKTLVDLVETSDVKLVKARACLTLGQLYDFWAAFPEIQNYAKLSRTECLSKAFEYYSKALEFQGDDPVIAAKAQLGIATVYEDQGEWDKAKAEYQRMVDHKAFVGDLANLAKARLDSLDSRRSAPRLVAMIPPPPAAKPAAAPGFPGLSLPGGGLGGGLLGPSSGSAFPGLIGGGTGGSSEATTTPGPTIPFGPQPEGSAPTSGPSSLQIVPPGAPTTAPATELR